MIGVMRWPASCAPAWGTEVFVDGTSLLLGPGCISANVLCGPADVRSAAGQVACVCSWPGGLQGAQGRHQLLRVTLWWGSDTWGAPGARGLSGPGICLPPKLPSGHSDEAGEDWLQEACRTLVSWAARAVIIAHITSHPHSQQGRGMNNLVGTPAAPLPNGTNVHVMHSDSTQPASDPQGDAALGRGSCLLASLRLPAAAAIQHSHSSSATGQCCTWQGALHLRACLMLQPAAQCLLATACTTSHACIASCHLPQGRRWQLEI